MVTIATLTIAYLTMVFKTVVIRMLIIQSHKNTWCLQVYCSKTIVNFRKGYYF